MIEINQLSKSFKREQDTLKVLDDISFTADKGEILCILGASGSGKSTLLRLMGGFDSYDSGSIMAEGKAVKSPSPDSILIFQEFNQLLPWKNVLHNITYPMKVNGKYGDDRQRREKAMEYLKMVKLDDFYDSYPHQLSGGMKQRTAIARALALEPSILLMDEPFGSLDALTRQSLQELLLQVWQRTRVTIIFVTHDIQEAIILADRIIVMNSRPGRIKDIVRNSLNRPRDISSGEYLELYGRLYSMLSCT